MLKLDFFNAVILRGLRPAQFSVFPLIHTFIVIANEVKQFSVLEGIE